MKLTVLLQSMYQELLSSHPLAQTEITFRDRVQWFLKKKQEKQNSFFQ